MKSSFFLGNLSVCPIDSQSSNPKQIPRVTNGFFQVFDCCHRSAYPAQGRIFHSANKHPRRDFLQRRRRGNPCRSTHVLFIGDWLVGVKFFAGIIRNRCLLLKLSVQGRDTLITWLLTSRCPPVITISSATRSHSLHISSASTGRKNS